MNIDFRRWFFTVFPHYYKANDSYKDIDGRGTLERMLDIPGEELHEYQVPDAENYLRIVDCTIADQRFLNHIAYSLGNPPDIILNETLYRKLLRYIIDIYKIKGTIRSYELLFNLLGFNVFVTEYPCEASTYDIALLYDEPDPNYYDTDCCKCSDYSIAFSTQANICYDPQTYTPLSQTNLDNLRKIIFFIEPINAHLRNLDYLFKICETTNWCLPEEISWEVRAYNLYDTGLLYDDSELYDDYLVTDSDVYTRDACNLPVLPYIRQENFGLVEINPTLGAIPVE